MTEHNTSGGLTEGEREPGVESLARILHDWVGGCCVERFDRCVFDGSGAREEATRLLAYPAMQDFLAVHLVAVQADLAHERQHVEVLREELDADAKHAALAEGESCDVCTHLESEQVQAWMAADLDWQDRAESAEAENARLRARLEAVEALAEEWAEEGPSLVRNAYSGANVVEGETIGRCATDLLAALDSPTSHTQREGAEG